MCLKKVLIESIAVFAAVSMFVSCSTDAESSDSTAESRNTENSSEETSGETKTQSPNESTEETPAENPEGNNEETSVDSVSASWFEDSTKVEGSFTYTVLGNTSDGSTGDDSTPEVTIVKSGDSTVTVKTAKLWYDPFLINSFDVTDVNVSVKDGVYTLEKGEFTASTDGKSGEETKEWEIKGESLSGTYENGVLTLSVTFTPGSMPFPIKQDFTSKTSGSETETPSDPSGKTEESEETGGKTDESETGGKTGTEETSDPEEEYVEPEGFVPYNPTSSVLRKLSTVDATLSGKITIPLGSFEMCSGMVKKTYIAEYDDGSVYATVKLGTGSGKIMGVSFTSFIDSTSCTPGYYDANGVVQNVANFTLSENTAKDTDGNAVNYVDSITFPVSKETSAYILWFYLNSGTKAVQFCDGSGSEGSGVPNTATKYSDSFTIDWSSAEVTYEKGVEQVDYAEEAAGNYDGTFTGKVTYSYVSTKTKTEIYSFPVTRTSLNYVSLSVPAVQTEYFGTHTVPAFVITDVKVTKNEDGSYTLTPETTSFDNVSISDFSGKIENGKLTVSMSVSYSVSTVTSIKYSFN